MLVGRSSNIKTTVGIRVWPVPDYSFADEYELWAKVGDGIGGKAAYRGGA
jgi:hypothetical protein